MPIDRNHRVPNVNGQTSVHEPGAYASVLQKVCSEKAHTADGDSVLIANTPDDVVAIERRCAERTAVLMRQPYGQLVNCRGYQLPRRLPAPFDRGGQRGFVVKPDDTITLKPREPT